MNKALVRNIKNTRKLYEQEEKIVAKAKASETKKHTFMGKGGVLIDPQ
jgi:hypothetical protein